VGRGFGQNIFDNARGEFSRPLILFQDDENPKPGFNPNFSQESAANP